MDTTKVIRQRGEIALSWVKTQASLPFQDLLKVPDPIDIHLHLPMVLKRNPRAGVTKVSFAVYVYSYIV